MYANYNLDTYMNLIEYKINYCLTDLSLSYVIDIEYLSDFAFKYSDIYPIYVYNVYKQRRYEIKKSQKQPDINIPTHPPKKVEIKTKHNVFF